MIAVNREAKRWAKYAGAPEAVYTRAHVYTEHTYSEEDSRASCEVFDSTGRRIWRRCLPSGQSATRAIAVRAGWVDEHGRDLHPDRQRATP